MSLELIIVTPRGEVFAGPVDRVVLPGVEGDFGVLEGHEKLIAALATGPIEIMLEDGTIERMAISGGFAEVIGERVVMLVDECRPEEF